MFFSSTSARHLLNLQNFATSCFKGKRKTSQYHMWWTARLDTQVYAQSDQLWKVMARLKPQHLNSDILCPRTQLSQSHRTQLGPSFKMAHWCYPPDSLGRENFSLGEFCRVKWKWNSSPESWASRWSMLQVQQILDRKKIDSFPVRVTCIETRSQGEQINDH